MAPTSCTLAGKLADLPAREREMAIVRTACLCRSDYEFAHHRHIGREVGLSGAEIGAIVDGADSPHWSTADATLLRAVDEFDAARGRGNGIALVQAEVAAVLTGQTTVLIHDALTE